MSEFLTPEGKNKIEQELGSLEEERLKVVKVIEEAVEKGDVSDNSDFFFATDERQRIEGKIEELRNLLKSAELVGEGGQRDKVSIGSKVEIRVGDKMMVYNIVGSEEADPAHNRISYQSPLGQALFDKKVGEQAEMNAPGGSVSFEILNIE